MTSLKQEEQKKCSNRIKTQEFQKFSNLKEINLPLIYFVLVFLALIQGGLNISISRKESIIHPIISRSNEITIKITGTGDLNIVNDIFNPSPDTIYLNDNLETPYATRTKSINIPTDGQTDNTIKLVWEQQLRNLNSIFSGFLHLLEADLSNLDTSLVTHMGDMFYNCPNITSINLANFNTELVESMRSMFY